MLVECFYWQGRRWKYNVFKTGQVLIHCFIIFIASYQNTYCLPQSNTQTACLIATHTHKCCQQLNNKGHYEGAHAHPAFHTGARQGQGTKEGREIMSGGNPKASTWDFLFF